MVLVTLFPELVKAALLLVTLSCTMLRCAHTPCTSAGNSSPTLLAPLQPKSKDGKKTRNDQGDIVHAADDVAWTFIDAP